MNNIRKRHEFRRAFVFMEQGTGPRFQRTFSIGGKSDAPQ